MLMGYSWLYSGEFLPAVLGDQLYGIGMLKIKREPGSASHFRSAPTCSTITPAPILILNTVFEARARLPIRTKIPCVQYSSQ